MQVCVHVPMRVGVHMPELISGPSELKLQVFVEHLAGYMGDGT